MNEFIETGIGKDLGRIQLTFLSIEFTRQSMSCIKILLRRLAECETAGGSGATHNFNSVKTFSETTHNLDH